MCNKISKVRNWCVFGENFYPICNLLLHTKAILKLKCNYKFMNTLFFNLMKGVFELKQCTSYSKKQPILIQKTYELSKLDIYVIYIK